MGLSVVLWVGYRLLWFGSSGGKWGCACLENGKWCSLTVSFYTWIHIHNVGGGFSETVNPFEPRIPNYITL